MKIIATTATGFLVEANRYELANIQGGYGNNYRPNVGEEIDVNAVYEDVRSLVNGNTELADAVKKFTRLLKALENMGTRIQPIADAASAKLKQNL